MKSKGQVFIWSLFDFANSSYAVIIVAFVFAVYFTDVICMKQPIGDFYWSLGINISMAVSAVLNPVCGAIADRSSNKKSFLLFFTVLAVIPTALMYFTGPGTVLFALFLFIVSNVGFQTGLTFYDAFISDIVDEKYYNMVSGIGYAVGYIGSLVSVVLVFPFKDRPDLLFVITSVFFLLFSLPLFLFLKEKKNRSDSGGEKINYFTFGFAKVFDTIKHIGKYRNLRNYLIAFFLYIDAVNTIIFFSGIYASRSLAFSITELAIFFIIVQITAMLGSFLFGYIGNKAGILRSIVITLVFWILIVVSIFLFIEKDSYVTVAGMKIHLFFIIGGFAGTFLGSTQALSRALMTKITPLEIKTEFFGFYALFEKTSTLLGPLTFGLVSWLSGSQKLAILSVGLFLLSGMIMLKKVREEKT
ncbi:MAG: MFS transporter [Ignavibacteriae bacterium]|nr:MFS transporter [Ignavibacteriota bacterium]